MHCPKMRGKGEFAFGVITLFVCFFAYCSSLITYRISFVIFALSIMLMIALAVRSGRIVSFDLRAIVPLLPWGAVAVMAAIGFVLGGGYDLSATIALVSVVVISYFAAENPNWILPAVKVFIGVLLIFALATIACYVAPQLYTGFIKPTFYSNVPMAMDYRSGLASHYSHNGTFCTIGLILASSMSFYGSESSSTKRFYGILALIFFIALVLTTKRAHLLCGIFAIGLVYLLSGNSHKYLKAIGVTVLVLLAVAILAPLVPGVEATIERLNSTFSSGTSFEDNVNNRTFLWNYALNGLSQAPLFGHGWTSYCYRWPDGFTITYMAHNELLNLLYETGFFGTALVLASCLTSFVLTFTTISRVVEGQQKAFLRLSLCIQVFFLSYAFTSGALFTTIPDLITYFFAIAITCSLRWNSISRQNAA